MKNKKILFLTYDSIKTPLLYSQGIPLLREISKMGYSPAIVTFEFEKLENEQYYSNLMSSYGIKWFKIKHCPLHIGPESSFDIIKGIIKVFFIVLKHKYNIIHCRSYIAGLIGLIVAKLTGRKHIFDMRGLYPDEYVLSGYVQKKSFLYKFYKFMEYLLIKNSNLIVVTSNRFKTYILKLYTRYVSTVSNKLEVIFNSTNLEKFKFDVEIKKKMRDNLEVSNKFVLIYSGSLAEWHLWKDAIKFFYNLNKVYQDLFFLFLTYKNFTEVEIEFNNFKIRKDKYKIVNASPEEINKYLLIGDIGIMFIKSHISKEIATPVKFGEFLSSGLPVIVNSSLVEISNIIKKYNIGIVYNNDELKDDNKIIGKFDVFRKNYTNTLRKRCINVAKKYFNLKDAINKYLYIYNRL